MSHHALQTKHRDFNHLVKASHHGRDRQLLSSLLLVAFSIGAVALGQRIMNPVGEANRSQAAVAVRTMPTLKQRTAAGESTQVIVQLAYQIQPEGYLDEGARAQQQAAIHAEQEKVLTTILKIPGVELLQRYKTIPYLALKVNQTALNALEGMTGVVSEITEDTKGVPTLSEVVPLLGANRLAEYGVQLTNQTVAIIDEGFDLTHPFLAGRAIDEICVADCANGTNYQTGPGASAPCNWVGFGNCDHGTMVAGVVVGNPLIYNNKPIAGVATGAKILPVRFVSKYANAYKYADKSDALKALETVYELRYFYPNNPIVAVNMSYGFDEFDGLCDRRQLWGSSFTAIINNLRSVGILSVFATGNGHKVNMTQEPSCIPSAIAVGAVDKQNTIAPYSNISKDLENVMLGIGGLTETTDPNQRVTTSGPAGSFVAVSGTSFAAPEVAGAIAILHAAAPGVMADQIVEALRTTGVMVTDNREGSTGKTYPRIQIDKAIEYLRNAGFTSSCTSTNLTVTCQHDAGSGVLGAQTNSEGEVLQASTGEYGNVAIVSASYRAALNTTTRIGSLTYCGRAMTQVGGVSGRAKYQHQTTEMWYLLNPPLGNCEYRAVFTGNPEDSVFSATIFNNVRQQNPFSDVYTNGSATGTAQSGNYAATRRGVKGSMMLCALSTYPNGELNKPELNKTAARELLARRSPKDNIYGLLAASSQRTADGDKTISWSTQQVQPWASTCANLALKAPIASTPIPNPTTVPSTPAPLPIVSVDLKANNSDGPVQITSGASISLVWTATNAQTCTASGDWTGNKEIRGTQTVGSVTTNRIYIISCTGEGGATGTDVVSVQVGSIGYGLSTCWNTVGRAQSGRATPAPNAPFAWPDACRGNFSQYDRYGYCRVGVNPGMIGSNIVTGVPSPEHQLSSTELSQYNAWVAAGRPQTACQKVQDPCFSTIEGRSCITPRGYTTQPLSSVATPIPATPFPTATVQPTPTFTASPRPVTPTPVLTPAPTPNGLVQFVNAPLSSTQNGFAIDSITYGTKTYTETDPALVYTGTWGFDTNIGYLGSRSRWTRTAGAAVTIDTATAATGTFSSNIVLRTKFEPTAGAFKVYTNGVERNTYYLNEATPRFAEVVIPLIGSIPTMTPNQTATPRPFTPTPTLTARPATPTPAVATVTPRPTETPTQTPVGRLKTIRIVNDSTAGTTQTGVAIDQIIDGSNGYDNTTNFFTFLGTWGLDYNPGYTGGFARWTRVRGNEVRFTTQAASVRLRTKFEPTAGAFTVYVDGVQKGTYRLTSPTTRFDFVTIAL